jgi:uncharacterized repeat protein (TIGR01451 family)
MATTDLSITIDDGTTSVVPGPGEFEIDTIVVTNNGGDVTGASVSVPVPAGVTGAEWVFVGGSGNVSGPTNGIGALATTVDLANGDSVEFFFQVDVDPAATGALITTATVTPPTGTIDTNTANNTATDSDTLTPQADLSVAMTDGKTTIVPGTSNTYTITVTNNGPSTLSSVTLTDAIPAALSNTSFGPSVGAYDVGTGVWSGLNLASGDSVSMALTGTINPSATGSLTNTVTVSPPSGTTDTDLTNNSVADTDTLTPQADLSVTVTDGTTTVALGTSDTYTIVVSNTGPSTAVGAAVSDLFPAAITAASWTAVASPGSSVAQASSTGNIATTVTLLPGGTATFTAVAQISPSASGLLTNTVTVSTPAGTTDPNPGNNTATDTDTLDAPAIHIVKFVNGQDADSPTGPHVVVGSTLTFTYVVTNTGDVPLANVVLTDDKLGPIASFTGDTNGNGLLDLTETWTYVSTATALAGQQTNVGTVTGKDVNTSTIVTDNNPANYFGDTLTPQADLSVAMTDGATTLVPGTVDTYTITVSNNGPDTVSSVTLIDAIPADLLNATFGSPSAGSYNPGSGLWSGLSLANGQSVFITLSGVIGIATGTLSNTVTVAAPAGVTDTPTRPTTPPPTPTR